ncbi:GNAT family N-acetyltransferase [Flagellimonas amoyensis]|uniref:GNAT family N-acetyltransferase n=1 Tax=Flagellimonas amoyensis TaxID=2169401 RepID=UPI000D3C0DAA|nr:GNAT family N-acetyltransferase [Allomuricauda amoyensis]
MKVILSTERLVISEAELSDATFILELLNSPTWIQFIGDKGIYTMEEAENYIQKSLMDSYQTHGFGLHKLCLKESMVPIGLCGFLKRDYLDHPDIGFALLPDHEGKGLMLEAGKALLEHSRSQLDFDEVLAIVLPSNDRSRQLLMKLGLQEIGKVTPKGSHAELLLFSNKKSHSNGAASS